MQARRLHSGEQFTTMASTAKKGPSASLGTTEMPSPEGGGLARAVTIETLAFFLPPSPGLDSGQRNFRAVAVPAAALFTEEIAVLSIFHRLLKCEGGAT